MSAGAGNTVPSVNRDLDLLAPKFRDQVVAAIQACEDAGLDAYVYEGYRSQELQALYYARGRTIIPPTKPVTNASSNLYSWHGYGLAVDVISRSKLWDRPESWFAQVAAIFRQHDCRWGGEWKMRDLPHFQWGRCKPSPSDLARHLISTQGLEAVWRAVGAV
ncbi:MAG TPA: M15 family metallopeptidase [Thermoanaerobaculia bacterium]|nr:M15 family metallopeptidase [Thermoanaerobaculia bacterium]